MPQPNNRTYDEYRQSAEKFQDFLATQSELPTEEQDLPEELSDWEQVWATATCHTEGCPAQGRGDDILLYINAAGAQAVCGPCGWPPTLIGHFTDGPREIPNTYPPPHTPDPGGGGDPDEGGDPN